MYSYRTENWLTSPPDDNDDDLLLLHSPPRPPIPPAYTPCDAYFVLTDNINGLWKRKNFLAPPLSLPPPPDGGYCPMHSRHHRCHSRRCSRNLPLCSSWRHRHHHFFCHCHRRRRCRRLPAPSLLSLSSPRAKFHVGPPAPTPPGTTMPPAVSLSSSSLPTMTTAMTVISKA